MSFQSAVAFILKEEGSQVVDDPSDPGGISRYGIALNRHPELTEQDIRTMTPQKAAQIYQGPQYWGAIRGSQMPDALQLPMLDTAVLSGPETAILCLQRALYVADDGKLGPQTLTAAASANPTFVLPRFAAERILAMSVLKNWAPNAIGWTTRAIAAVMVAQQA